MRPLLRSNVPGINLRLFAGGTGLGDRGSMESDPRPTRRPEVIGTRIRAAFRTGGRPRFHATGIAPRQPSDENKMSADVPNELITESTNASVPAANLHAYTPAPRRPPPFP